MSINVNINQDLDMNSNISHQIDPYYLTSTIVSVFIFSKQFRRSIGDLNETLSRATRAMTMTPMNAFSFLHNSFHAQKH